MDIDPTRYGFALALGLFVAMLGFVEIGRNIGNARLNHDPSGARNGANVIESAVLSLLALMISFTFLGANTRFETNQRLLIEETNHIKTAWTRLGLIPSGSATEIRKLFKEYVDARIASYRKMPDVRAADLELNRAEEIRGRIWSGAVAALKDANGAVPGNHQLLQSITQMAEIMETRQEVLNIHPHPIIYVMLTLLSLVAALLAGCGMAGAKRRSWLHVLGFALAVSLTVYVISDIEYPLFGWFRPITADRVMVELRKGME